MNASRLVRWFRRADGADLTEAARLWVREVEQRGGSAPWLQTFEAVVACGIERKTVFDAFWEAKKAGVIRNRPDEWVELAGRER